MKRSYIAFWNTEDKIGQFEFNSEYRAKSIDNLSDAMTAAQHLYREHINIVNTELKK